MYKEYIYRYNSGTEALAAALKQLKPKVAIIPSYTCEDIPTACKLAGVRFIIVDCEKNLQISLKAIKAIEEDFDCIIVPHMFGIQAPIKKIAKAFPDIDIIEDCSQAHGLPDIGKYSRLIISSVNSTKWLKGKEHIGLVYSNEQMKIGEDVTIDPYIAQLHATIIPRLKNRLERARELTNAGIELVGNNQPNSYLRGMYFTDKQKRLPYIPLHDIYSGFDCPIVDSFKHKLDWISIYD